MSVSLLTTLGQLNMIMEQGFSQLLYYGQDVRDLSWHPLIHSWKLLLRQLEQLLTESTRKAIMLCHLCDLMQQLDASRDSAMVRGSSWPCARAMTYSRPIEHFGHVHIFIHTITEDFHYHCSSRLEITCTLGRKGHYSHSIHLATKYCLGCYCLNFQAEEQQQDLIVQKWTKTTLLTRVGCSFIM